MEEFLQSVLDSSNVPIITAFVLGILTAISPCPMATNITAIGYISKDLENQRRIFRNGLLYALGRTISYTTLGIVLISILKKGASVYAIQHFIGKYGEMVIGPALILTGLFMLFAHRLNLPSFGFNKQGGEQLKSKGGWGALWLGVLFALAFCPTSGVFYFGMLIPMSSVQPAGYLLPVVFAVATALPVIVTAWILAYSLSGIGKFYKKIQVFEKWFRTVVAVIFIGVGIYYSLLVFS